MGMLFPAIHPSMMSPYGALRSPCVMSMSCCLSRPYLQLKYKEDYNKNVKGQWCETPYFDVATARVAMENLSNVNYEILSFTKNMILQMTYDLFAYISTFGVVFNSYSYYSLSFPPAEEIHEGLGGRERPNQLHADGNARLRHQQEGRHQRQLGEHAPPDDWPLTHATLT